MSMTPQVRRIRNHLLRGNSITQRSALMDFGIMALPRRIADLKETGFPIETQMDSNNATGQRFAVYSMKTRLEDVRELKEGCTYRVTGGRHPFSPAAVANSDGYFTVQRIHTVGEPMARVEFSGTGQIISNSWFKKPCPVIIEYVGGLS